jgi:hypothetical protein
MVNYFGFGAASFVSDVMVVALPGWDLESWKTAKQLQLPRQA